MRYNELLIESAARELAEKLHTLHKHDYNSIDKLMQNVSAKHKMTGKKLHDLFVHKYGHTPDVWIKKLKSKLGEESVNEFASYDHNDGEDDGDNEERLQELYNQKFYLESIVIDSPESVEPEELEGLRQELDMINDEIEQLGGLTEAHCVKNESVAESSLEELANTSLKVKEPKDMYNVNDRKQTTYKVFKFKSGKNTFLINFTVKGSSSYGKKQNWNAVNVAFGVKEEQDDYSFGDEINTNLTARNKNQFLIYSTVINTIRRFITEYNTEIDEIIMQGAGERQEAMYQRFFQSAGKYFPGWHYNGKHSLVRDVPRPTGKKVREQGVLESEDIDANIIIKKLQDMVTDQNDVIANADYDNERQNATIVRDRALKALYMIKSGSADVGVAWKYFQTGEQGVAEEVNPEVTRDSDEYFEPSQNVRMGDFVFNARTFTGALGEPNAKGLQIRAYNPKNLKRSIGSADFIVKKDKKGNQWLESDDTEVDDEYRGKGVATMMYAFAKSLGNDIKSSPYQSNAGKNMWGKWGSDGKHLGQQGVAEGKLNEIRDQLWTWVQSKFPRTQWPEYVQRDFLYQQAKGIRNQAELDDFLKRNRNDFGKVQWRLEKLPITMDIFTPKTQKMILSREGGSSNPFQVPRDAERHSQQLKMIQQKGVSEEPIIVAKLSNGYDLIEGWHRTIQHLKEFPQGYTAPAWVGYGATYTSESVKQGVAEETCPHCAGPMFSELMINEKKDACYYKVKSRYKVWPSAYASGALVKCRKKGSANWGNGGQKSESMTLEQLEESLHDWFTKEKWVRMDTKGNIKGPCAKEPGEGKPKCLPQSKAHSLGKKGRASAAQRKRREDPNPERSGKAINVNTKKKTNEEQVNKIDDVQLQKSTRLIGSARKKGVVENINKKYNEFFVESLSTDTDVIKYVKESLIPEMRKYNVPVTPENHFTRISSSIFESVSKVTDSGQDFLDVFNRLDQRKNIDIRVGQHISILNLRMSQDFAELFGFKTPKKITKIYRESTDKKIVQLEFNNDPEDVWPRKNLASFNGKLIMTSAFFPESHELEKALTVLQLSKPDSINLRTNISEEKSHSALKEGVDSSDDIQKIKDFINWSIKQLHIQKPYPKITLSRNTKVAQQGHHTGVHTEDNKIWVYIENRNLIDIFRTIFHELVHERQSQLNMIKDGDSYPGSPIEAMADMVAGKYIKIYGKDHPEIFQ